MSSGNLLLRNWRLILSEKSVSKLLAALCTNVQFLLFVTEIQQDNKIPDENDDKEMTTKRRRPPDNDATESQQQRLGNETTTM